MSKARRKSEASAPTRDPRTVAVVRRTAAGFALLAARQEPEGLRVAAVGSTGPDGREAASWIQQRQAARTVVALPGEQVIVRAVQLPDADEQRLRGALELNASTFVLGRTPSWRVAAALLPGTRGNGLRTGLVAEWPEESGAPSLPHGLAEGADVSFAPSVAGLAALVGIARDPVVHVDDATGVLSVCVPTAAGVLARTVRVAQAGGRISPQDVAQAVGEACVHAGLAGNEIPAAIGRAVEAAALAAEGGFGCTQADLARLSAAIPGPDGQADADWWRAHGLEAGLAAAALGGASALTRMQSSDLAARPDRAAAVLNRLSEPRTARRLIVAGAIAIVLGPLALEGGRLLLLRWKLPDLPAYLKAEDVDRRKQAMYRVLGRQGASMTKTLSDLACCAPDGIEMEFVNVAQASKGQAVTIRGKARPAGKMQGTEVLLELERQLRESSAFEAINRSSDPPDARGYQAFTLAATAVRPTYLVAFPESQDFAKVSMRERRYGPPPADVDPVASGLGADWKAPGAAEATVGATEPARPADRGTGSGSTDGEQAVTGSREATGSRAPASTTADAGDAEARASAEEDGAGTRAGRGSRSGGGTRSGLATRSNPASSGNEPEPPPPPVTENEVNTMSREEAKAWLVKVSKARNRADLDQAVQDRLKREFDLLIERCKRE